MSQIEEGGTKIQRRIQSSHQHSSSPPPSQQSMSQQQYYTPPPPMQTMQQPMQVMQPPMQVMQPPMHESQPMQSNNNNNGSIVQEKFKPPKSKSTFSVQTNEISFKHAILVCLLFILLNSKMVWRQIIKLPLMGSVEPSIIALLVNSILSGLIFYIILKLKLI